LAILLFLSVSREEKKPVLPPRPDKTPITTHPQPQQTAPNKKNIAQKPIPPLDGSRILTGILPPDLARSYASIERYGFILLIILAVSGVLSKLIIPLINFANSLLLS